MARTGRPKAELVLSDVERETLVDWSLRAKTAQALALRSRIVLASADGAPNKEVAAALRVVPATVGNWRGRFITDRLEGLSDEPRPGAVRAITDEQVEAVIVKTLEEAPVGDDTHWSTRSMAKAQGLSSPARCAPQRPHTPPASATTLQSPPGPRLRDSPHESAVAGTSTRQPPSSVLATS